MALEQRQKKMVVALGLLLAVAVIFGGAQMLRHRGTSSEDTDTTVLGAPTTPLPAPSPTGGKSGSKVPTFQGLDPFQTEVVLPPPSPSPSPTQAVEPSPVPSSNPSAPSSAVVGGHTVSLLDVFQQGGTDQAVVMVDGTVYTVKAGDGFAKEYSVKAIQDPCATFSWQSQQTFDLCSPNGP